MLLAFVVVLFCGLAFMFFCILRAQEALHKTVREEHALMMDRLRQLESRVVAGYAPGNSGDAHRSGIGMVSSERDLSDMNIYSRTSGSTESQGLAWEAPASSPLDEMNLQLEPSTPSRSTSRRESGLPDLKL